MKLDQLVSQFKEALGEIKKFKAKAKKPKAKGARVRKTKKTAVSREEETATRVVAGGLSLPKSREIYEIVQTREVLNRLPDIAEGTVAHFLFAGSPITRSLQEAGAGRVLVGYIGKVRTASGDEPREFRFQTAADRLPLRERSCRFALVSAPLSPGLPMMSLVKEVGRILESGSTAIILDWHPYSAAVQSLMAKKAAIDESEGIGLEKYFRAFKEAELTATEVREAFVDGSLRKMMETEDEKEWYADHRREPLFMALFVKKR